MFASKWELICELRAPCADISYQWSAGSDARLVVLMHFTWVNGGYGRDLELTFAAPAALQWEREVPGLIALPDSLPRLGAGDHPQWTYPTLEIEDSPWADLYRDAGEHGVRHFALVSLNDLLHVLCEDEPAVRLIDPDAS